jgi:hypothetical protein
MMLPRGFAFFLVASVNNGSPTNFPLNKPYVGSHRDLLGYLGKAQHVLVRAAGDFQEQRQVYVCMAHDTPPYARTSMGVTCPAKGVASSWLLTRHDRL